MKKNKSEINSRIAILAVVFLSLIQIAIAIPDSISIQGKLTNTAGTIQTGTFNFTFRIYDSFTGGNMLYETNTTTTTDSRGVYDIILKNVNISFEEQLYLAVKVSNDGEMEPRINLTSVPYTFRANTSEDLNKNKSYTAANLNATGNITLGDRLTFGLGEFIDNLVSGWLKLTGALNITSGLVVGGGLNVSEDFRVNERLNITSTGNLVTAGSINASATIQGSTLSDGTATITGGVLSASQVQVGGGFSSGGLTIQSDGNIVTQGDVLFSGNVTVINVTFLSVNGSIIPALDNQFDIGNASFRWRNANFSNIGEFGSITTPTIRATSIQNLAGTDYGFVRGANFNLGNISNNTLVKGDNSSISLWNVSGSNIYPRGISSNVGIGTTEPTSKLNVIGHANITGNVTVGSIRGNGTVPTGMIAFFASTSCPAGWSEYTASRGFAIVGLVASGTAAGTVGTALTNQEDKTHTHTGPSHTHGAGTLAGPSHTHGAGTLAGPSHTHTFSDTVSSSTDSGGAHTHGYSTVIAHTHAVDPPSTASGGVSVGHTHAVDPPSTSTSSDGPQSGSVAVQGGTGQGVTDQGGLHSHTVDIGSFTSGAQSVDHTHSTDIGSFTSGSTGSVSATTDSGGAHTHTMTDFTASGTTSASGTGAVTGATAADGTGAVTGATAADGTGNTGTAATSSVMPYIQLLACQAP